MTSDLKDLPAPPRTNDGSGRAPRLELFLNLGTLVDLPAWSSVPRGSDAEVYAAVRAAGFAGVQGGEAALARDAGMMFAGGGRINAVGEADAMCRAWKDEGAVCATVHAMWGIEGDAEVDALVGDILEASDRHGVPVYIETHRATLTQDMWRTVRLVERVPSVRFNGDFSHWYTGQEMPYGDFDAKLAFMAPVLERVGFMHGRIGNPQCIQVGMGEGLDAAAGLPFVKHYEQIWKAVFSCFKRDAGRGDWLGLAPELLFPSIDYARTFVDPTTGEKREESDRWQQALLMAELARRWFAEA